MSSIEIPNFIKHIGFNICQYCESLVSVVLPKGINTVDLTVDINKGSNYNGLFDGCTSLKSIEFGNGFSVIPGAALEFCDNLEFVDFGDSASAVYCPFGANTRLNNLKVLNFGKNVKLMETEYAYYMDFDNPSYISSIVFPDNLLSIVIYDGQHLTHIYSEHKFDKLVIPDSVTDIIHESKDQSMIKMEGPGFDGIVIGKSVKAIPQRFLGSQSLADGSSIEFRGNEVTSIGDFGFSDETRISSINLPDSIKYIGDHALQDMLNVSALHIPTSIEYIGKEAFLACRVKQLDFTGCNNLKYIGDSAFEGDTGSEYYSLTLPDSVEYIGANAFTGRPLSSVYLGKNLSVIGYDAIGEYSGSELRIPDSVVQICNEAFSYCPNLSVVYLGENLKSINPDFGGHFRDCGLYGWDFARIYVPTYEISAIVVEQTGIQPYKVILLKTNLLYASDDGSIIKRINKDIKGILTKDSYDEVIQENGKDLHLIEIIIGNKVTAIDDHAFDSCSRLIKAIIPESVESIGEYAFKTCNKLHDVSSDNIDSIKKYAFYSDYSLSNVYLTNAKSIGEYAFARCNSLSTVDFPSVISANGNIFYECSGLISVSLPNLSSITGSHHFCECYSLESLDVSKISGEVPPRFVNNCLSLKKINAISMYGKTNLDCFKGIKISSIGNDDSYDLILSTDNFGELGTGTFENCINLTGASFANVSVVNRYAFAGCTSLSTVNLSNLVKIESDAFKDSGLLSIDVGRVQVLPANLFQNTPVNKCVFNNVTTLEYSVFNNTTDLISVEFPSIEKILGYNTFENSNILSVFFDNLPKLMSKGIETYAFGNVKDDFRIYTTEEAFLSIKDSSDGEYKRWALPQIFKYLVFKS